MYAIEKKKRRMNHQYYFTETSHKFQDFRTSLKTILKLESGPLTTHS
jgi:hypothetical protein